MKKRAMVWSGGILLVLFGLITLVPLCRFMALGVVTREHFHEWRPTGYWINVLKNGNDQEREHAAFVLGELGPDTPGVVPALAAALTDRQFLIRKHTCIALRKIGPDAAAAVPNLLVLLHDESPLVRREAAITLGYIHSDAKTVIPALLAALHDGDGWVQIHAVGSLGGFGPEAAVALPVLGDLLKTPAGREGSIAQSTMRTLEAIGPAALPLLLQALASSQAESRSNAMLTLTRMGAKEAIPQIKPMLKDPDGFARITAADCLRKLDPEQSEAVVPVFIEGLKDQKSWRNRGTSAYILADIGPRAKEAVPALTEALKDRHDDIRRLVVDALAAMGPAAKSAVPALHESLQDEEVLVRRQAAEALQKIAGESVTVGPEVIK